MGLAKPCQGKPCIQYLSRERRSGIGQRARFLIVYPAKGQETESRQYRKSYPRTFLHERCQRLHVLLPLYELRLGLLQRTLLFIVGQAKFFVRRGGHERRLVGHDRLDVLVLGFLLQILKLELAEKGLAGSDRQRVVRLDGDKDTLFVLRRRWLRRQGR